jgi:hypothetical protein
MRSVEIFYKTGAVIWNTNDNRLAWQLNLV